MLPHVAVPVAVDADAHEARAAASCVATLHGVDDGARGRIALIVTELATRDDWTMAGSPGLQCEPAVIAAWLARDYANTDEDVTVVMLKRGRSRRGTACWAGSPVAVGGQLD